MIVWATSVDISGAKNVILREGNFCLPARQGFDTLKELGKPADTKYNTNWADGLVGISSVGYQDTTGFHS